MIQVKKNLMLAFVLSAAFFLVSAPVFASQDDYHQRQNKIDDKLDSGKQSQSNTVSKKKGDEEKSGKSSSDQSNRNANKAVEVEKKSPSGTEKKGNY